MCMYLLVAFLNSKLLKRLHICKIFEAAFAALY